MRIRHLLSLLLLAALVLPASAQVPGPPGEPTAEELQRARAQGEAWQAYALRVARALGRSDGARDLALAALLEATARPVGDDGGQGPAIPEAGRWSTDAVAKGAGDAITQQLLLAAGIAGGDREAAAAAARRWQALEPGNLAPLLLQGLPAEQLLAAAGQAGRNTPDPILLQRWIAGALRAHPPTAREWAGFGEGPRPSADAHAAVWAGSLQALLVPDYRGLMEACTGRQLRLAGRPGTCGHVSQLLLARPQTVLDESIGLSLARSLSRSAAERAPLDARRRGVDWRQEQMMELAARDDGSAGDQAEALARALADPALDTEDALQRRLLSEARLSQEPPSGWAAPWERGRR